MERSAWIVLARRVLAETPLDTGDRGTRFAACWDDAWECDRARIHLLQDSRLDDQSDGRTHPQLVGLSCELEQPGDYLSFSLGSVPVLLWRATTGELRAFVNACAHQGAAVATRHGNARTLTCPRHGWVFRDDGWLETMPRSPQPDERDRPQYGLRTLPCAERHGLLFVAPDTDEDFDVDTLLAELGPELAGHAFDRSSLARSATPVLGGEKRRDLSLEESARASTSREAPHAESARIRTASSGTDSTAIGGAVWSGEPVWNGEPIADRYGSHTRRLFASCALEGLRHRAEKEWDPAPHITLAYDVFPSTLLLVHPEVVVLARVESEAEGSPRRLRYCSYAREGGEHRAAAQFADELFGEFDGGARDGA